VLSGDERHADKDPDDTGEEPDIGDDRLPAGPGSGWGQRDPRDPMRDPAETDAALPPLLVE
jgi:hypothetical protein